MPSRTFVRSRARAFQEQGGRCHYCGSAMWLDRIDDPTAFAARHLIPRAKVREFVCTGEHLIARQDGGDDSPANIVAACWHCNRKRHHHRPSKAPAPAAYKRRVQQLIAKGRWLSVLLMRAGTCHVAPMGSPG